MAEDAKDDAGGGRIAVVSLAGLVAGPLLALAILSSPAPEGMPPEAWRMVAVVAWMVVWWLTEAVAISATALLPLVLMPLLGVVGLDDTAAAYADPLIFLFLGGFLLAAAMQATGLHRRIALAIVAAVGTTPSRIVLGFMLATAFLSMWISNTATSIMMYAVGISVIDFAAGRGEDEAGVRRFGVALMLGIAYAASIGGTATLIGTPPNALLASFLSDNYDVEITFWRWMLLGVPVAAVMLPLAWVLLTQIRFATRSLALGDAARAIGEERRALGRMDRAEIWVGIVFLLAATFWILRRPIGSAIGTEIDDTVVAIAAALLLFAVPLSRERGPALDWASAERIPWGVLVLFGGGLALANGFSETGLAEWIGEAVSAIEVSTVVLVIVVTAAIVALTEITSNTASTATFLPILGAVGVGLGLDAAVLTVPVALGASMAFMMPVATPPNAIVFSYPGLTLPAMAITGLWLNLVGVVAIVAAFLLIGPYVFGFAL
ncbi:MAG: SLC13 family permease [Paracoccaceae bacterium]